MLSLPLPQLPARSSSGESSCPVALEQLSVGSSDPYLVLGSCSDAVLRLYDIRCPTPVAAIAAGPSPITGLVLEPCRRPAVIATGGAEEVVGRWGRTAASV